MSLRILFTGASSFTGFWFARELARAGHEVVATFQSPVTGYEGVRRERVDMLRNIGEAVPECSFGDERFLDLVRSGPWDVLCHHGADVTDYKSRDFDVCRALKNNTRSLRAVLRSLNSAGCRKVVITGSIFEPDEGVGSDGLRAFSPYGLSKALTAAVFRYEVPDCGMRLGKFVIPNPFGPYEESRFTAYLIRSWWNGDTPAVDKPAYVRDNVHVSLLALAYARFVERVDGEAAFEKMNPSGYPESQGAFARRVADEMRDRLHLPCRLELRSQEDFPEPRVRINTDALDPTDFRWSEPAAWDELADYYRRALGAEGAASPRASSRVLPMS